MKILDKLDELRHAVYFGITATPYCGPDVDEGEGAYRELVKIEEAMVRVCREAERMSDRRRISFEMDDALDALRDLDGGARSD